MVKRVTINDFLTWDEILQAQKLKDAEPICEEIIKPNIDRINRILKQQNDPMYIAYAVEFVINQTKKR